MVDDGRTDDDGPWLYYKLTNKPKGSGELTTSMYQEKKTTFDFSG